MSRLWNKVLVVVACVFLLAASAGSAKKDDTSRSPSKASPAAPAADAPAKNAENTLPPEEKELGPASMDRVRNLLSQIPPSFTPDASEGKQYVACELQRRGVRKTNTMIAALEGMNLDQADKAELAEIKKELVRRREAICGHYLRAVDRYIPSDFRDVPRNKMDEYRALVATAQEEAEYFVTTYPTSKWATEARYYLARLLFLNINIYLTDLAEDYKDKTGKRAPADLRSTWKTTYFDRIFDLLKKAREAEDLPARLERPAMKLWADALINVGKRTEGAAEYIEYIQKYPKAPTVVSGLTYVIAGQQFLYAQKPAEAEKILLKALKVGDKLDYHPHVIDFLYKSYTALGKIEEAEALWQKWGPEFVDRSKDSQRSEFQRMNYKTFSEWYLFRLGYVNFALGRYEQAKDKFRQHLEKYAGASNLNPATTVFLQRSTKLKEILEEQIGTQAPPFDLEGLWAWNRSFSLKAHAGKVIALCFRTYGSSRVHPCLRYLERTFQEFGGEQGPFIPASIAFLKGTKDIPGQLLKVEEEATALGLTYSCGLDPTEGREIFTQLYKANVGSATLIFIDPLGRIVYYEQDPRPNAFGIFDTIIARLMGK